MLLALAMVTGTITILEPNGVNVANAAEENLITNGVFDTVSDWIDQDGVAVPAQNEEDKVTITEYLINGDFEDVSTNNWIKGAITSGVGYNGTSGLVYTPSSEGAETYLEVPGLDTTGETIYTLKIRVKTENAPGNMYSMYSTENSGKWNPLQALSANTDWTEYTTTFTTTSGQYRIGIEVPNKTGKVYIDDVSITTESKEWEIIETNVAVNGDFEDASINKWLTGTITTGAGSLAPVFPFPAFAFLTCPTWLIYYYCFHI